MRAIVCFLLFSFCSVYFLQAQQSNPNQTNAINPNAAEITFDKIEHDYGTIVQGDDGTCYFTFTNTGKEPLILSKPISSCGCTVPEYPKEPILPGNSDKIKVTYNTRNIGPINKSVTVYSNAQSNRIVLKIKGQVVAKPAITAPEKNNDLEATPINK